ncbi:MAG: NYN domain-containing protein [Nitrospirae bacterium]|nr:NYN domain-containing protein [Nitrospirota bacterium]
MSYILIDGYNLIGIVHRDIEEARSNLISRLCEYSNLKHHDVTVVFDGWKDGQLNETSMQKGRVTVVFSRLGEKADLVIKRILLKDKKSWIVISSDREIADFARNRGFVSLTSSEFERKLYLAGSITEKDEDKAIQDEEENETGTVRRKGNPYKPSKKQKQKQSAIKKL